MPFGITDFCGVQPANLRVDPMGAYLYRFGPAIVVGWVQSDQVAMTVSNCDFSGLRTGKYQPEFIIPYLYGSACSYERIHSGFYGWMMVFLIWRLSYDFWKAYWSYRYAFFWEVFIGRAGQPGFLGRPWLLSNFPILSIILLLFRIGKVLVRWLLFQVSFFCCLFGCCGFGWGIRGVSNEIARNDSSRRFAYIK